MTFLASVLTASSNSSSLNDIEPGLLGFLVVAGIGVALVFLLRSMNKQFRKLGPPEDADSQGAGQAADDEDAVAQDSVAQDTGAEGAKRG